MATEIASAYVTIMPSLKGAAKTISNELSGIDTSSVGRSIGAKMGGGISSGLSTAKIAIGNIVANVASTGISAIASNIDSAISRVDSLNRFPLIMQQLGLSADDAKAATTRLSDGIEGLPTTLDAATNGVTRFVAKNGDINKSTSYFLAMNDALVAGGQSTEIQSAAMEQLMQSYSKGKMDMVEWRSVQTAMPQVLNQVAAAMGTTADALGEGLRNGTISMEDFMDTLVKIDTEGVNGMSNLSEQAKTACGGIGTSFVNVGSAITRNLANIINVINGTEDGITASGGRITNILNSMKGGIDAFGAVAVNATRKAVSTIEGLANGTLMFAGVFNSVRDSAVSAFGTIADRLGQYSGIISAALPVASVVAFAASFSKLFPIVNGFIEPFGGLSGALSAFVTRILEVGGAAGSVITAIATKVDTFGRAVTLCGGGVSGFAQALGGGLVSALGGLLNPVTLIVAGIVALGVAFAYLFTTNEEFRNTVISLGQSILASLAPALLVITQAVQNLAVTVGPALMNIFNMLVPVLGQIIIVIMQIVAALAPVVTMLITTLVPTITVVIQLVTMIVETVLALVLPMISQILNAIEVAMPTIQVVIMAVMGAVLAYIEFAWPIIQTVIKAAMDAISAVIHTVWPLIQTIITTVMNVVQAVIQTVMAIIQGDWDGAWNGVKGIFSAVWDGITSIASAMGAILGGIVSGIVSAVVDFFSNMASSVAEFVSGMVEAVIEFFTNLANDCIDAASNLWESVCSAFSAGVDAAVSFVSSLVSSVVDFFSSLWSSITSAASSMWESVSSAFSSGVESAVGFVSSLPGRVMDIFSGAGSWLVDSGSSLISGFVNGVLGAIDWAASEVSGALSSIRAMFPFSPAKEGPFSGKGWVLYSGISTAEAFGEGFEKEAGSTRSRIEKSLSGMQYGIGADISASGATDAEAAYSDRVRSQAEQDALVGAIYEAVSRVFASGVDVNVDKREFGRMVRSYA